VSRWTSSSHEEFRSGAFGGAGVMQSEALHSAPTIRLSRFGTIGFPDRPVQDERCSQATLTVAGAVAFGFRFSFRHVLPLLRLSVPAVTGAVIHLRARVDPHLTTRTGSCLSRRARGSRSASGRGRGGGCRLCRRRRRTRTPSLHTSMPGARALSGWTRVGRSVLAGCSYSERLGLRDPCQQHPNDKRSRRVKSPQEPSP
jgi:hypothetical protein